MNTTVSNSVKTRNYATIEMVRQPRSGTAIAAPTHADIAAKAYEIYISGGRQPGQAERDWLEAEAQLRAKSQTPRQSPSPSNAWPMPASEGGDETGSRGAGSRPGSQAPKKYAQYSDSQSADSSHEPTNKTHKREVGLWIDHRNAVIVAVLGNATETKLISSHLEGDTRLAAGRAAPSKPEDTQDRRAAVRLNRYYDEVISSIRTATDILIFGPGEAKGELARRIESRKLHARLLAVETADKMTGPQITAKVRERFTK